MAAGSLWISDAAKCANCLLASILFFMHTQAVRQCNIAIFWTLVSGLHYRGDSLEHHMHLNVDAVPPVLCVGQIMIR